MTIDRAKKQDKAEQEQLQQQQQMQEQQQQREQEQHDMSVEEAKSRHAHGAVAHESLKDSAKEVGAASKPLEINGKSTANPINSDLADES